MTDQRFFIAAMGPSRRADYYLGYMDGCVFLDFNNYSDGRICLTRISFDGYGCCELGEISIALNKDDSRTFKAIIEASIQEQDLLLTLVKKAIDLNKGLIWTDALEEYNLT